MPHTPDIPRVVVSNGSYRFHLSTLAAELSRSGHLAALITGGYPKGFWKRSLEAIPLAGIRRLLDRREELPDALVSACNTAEIWFKTGDLLFGKYWPDAQHRLHRYAFSQYAAHALRRMEKMDYHIYHYRNCFGGVAAQKARAIGRKTLCDHSIGHPYAVSWIRRQMAATIPSHLTPQPLNILEQQYLEDFTHADHFLVNSDFVKSTFVASGVDASKVSVVYWGVDSSFLRASDEAMKGWPARRPSSDLLFCGGFGHRKGAFELMEALDCLEDKPWTLTVAGGIEPEVIYRWSQFIQRHKDRITFLGFMPRDVLAHTLSSFRTFVFPSLMEGSARVVFEALASGCYVITTQQAGSVVEDGIHGKLTSPGSVKSLTEAIQATCLSGFDEMASEMGKRNAIWVREMYRPEQYAARVVSVYEKMLDN